ncbi:putative ubiquitin carboxyl-terminal hydrolase K02C4.3 [Caenorhabditis elegans]|uniref:putative ubiquitin carboxyl-terminal hydrolase K02C4.3 n=1 Tax=Caenorhabditis elegans TaxID=6239 RepID=UPI00077FE54A|nr:putative ubiquitin carboxyl-terminal hydrolase K02C4.3 [Caenorhabditis elegans]CAA87786.4 Probable ubiquitin carboxyl-terminal hydrolase K02C4.3 [Caenorhabditis elegans]|eukprot:NP_001309441.1 Probable ubiquitin carboxyl-terminal hydrolase K02C4.3 [Caenorhabditis elegans]
MVEENETGTPGTSRTVTFHDGRKLTDAEHFVFFKVKEVIADKVAEAEILESIRKRSECKPTDEQFISDIINELFYSGEPPKGRKSERFIGPLFDPEKASTASGPMDCTDVVSYDSTHPNISEISKKEEVEMQSAIQQSLASSASQNISRPTMLMSNLEDMVRNPNFSTGLYNSGNTCWLNCLSQVLYSIPKFRSILYHCAPLSWHEQPITNVKIENQQHAELLMLFRGLFAELQFSEMKYIEVGPLINMVDKLSKSSKGPSTIGTQQDATEMLTLIFDWLQRAFDAALHAQLNPEFSNVSDEENLVISDSTTTAPNSDIIGAPPGYNAANLSLPSSSHVDPKSTLNPMYVNEKEPSSTPTSLFGTRSKTIEVNESMDTEAATSSNLPGNSVENHPNPAAPEVDDNKKAFCDKLKESFNNIFSSVCYTESVAEDGTVSVKSNVRNCPQFFQLQVTYGNLHDALEAATFDHGLGNTASHVRNLYDPLPAVIFFGLSRFSFNSNIESKLHDKFTFPKIIFMDRYLKCNKEQLVQLRSHRELCRDSLSEVRAKLSGLRRYPQGNGEVRLEDSFQTVWQAVSNFRDREDAHENTAFVGPLTPSTYQSSSDNCSSKFVKDGGKLFPTFTEGFFPGKAAFIETLQNMLEALKTEERDCLAEEARLQEVIDQTYEVPELQQHKYELHAIIVHSGEANRGHYWTYKLKKSIDGLEEWEKLNDQNADRVDWPKVESDSFGTGSRDAPSAYMLMYVRSDAEWLVSADKLTALEAFETIPPDLQEKVLQKRDEFKEKLQRFRENKEFNYQQFSVDSPTVQSTEETPSSFSWYRDELEDIDIGDENANPTKNDYLLNARLDSYSVPIAPDVETSEMKRMVSQMWNQITKIAPRKYTDSQDLLDSNLRSVMEGESGGINFINSRLGYDIHELRSDADNDVEGVYNAFINEYLGLVKDLHELQNSKFVVFVGFQLQRIHVPVLRYLLVRAMAVSELGIISQRANNELSGMSSNSHDKGTAMLQIALLLSHFFELGVMSAWGCRSSLENIHVILNDFKKKNSRGSEQIEVTYCAMIGARNARICNGLLREMAYFLESYSIFFVSQKHIEACTVFSTITMIKLIMQHMASKTLQLIDMEFHLSKNERRVRFEDIIREVVSSVCIIHHWSKSYSKEFQNEINLKELMGLLHLKVEFMVSLTSFEVADPKYECLQAFKAMVVNTVMDLERASNELDYDVLDGAVELRELKKYFKELQLTDVKVNNIITSYDPIIESLVKI